MSGRGKTTLFEGIFWCLYGKLQKVAPNSWDASEQRKNRTHVKIKFTEMNMTVKRWTNSSILNVVITRKSGRKVMLEDTPAQDHINSIFGSSDFWMSTSYLRQKQMNTFITGSANEKLALITAMAFQEENPGEYIDVVDKTTRAKDKELLKLETKTEVEIDTLERKLEKYNLTKKDLDNTPDVKELQQELEELEEELSRKKRLLSDYNSLSSELERINSQISQYELDDVNSQISQYEMDIETINNLSSVISLQKAYRHVKDKIGKLEKEIFNNLEEDEVKKIKKGISGKSKYSTKEISRVQKNTSNYSANVSKCSKLDIEYDESVIKTRIKELREKLNLYKQYEQFKAKNDERIKLQDKIIVMKEKLKQLEENKNTLPEFDSTDYETKNDQSDKLSADIDDLEKQLIQLKNYKKSSEYKNILTILSDPPLECPKCSSHLRYNPTSEVKLTTVLDFDKSSLEEKLVQIKNESMEKFKKIRDDMLSKNEIYEKLIEELEQLDDVKKQHKTLDKKIHSQASIIRQLKEDLNDIDVPEIVSRPDFDLDNTKRELHFLLDIEFISKSDENVEDMLKFNSDFDLIEKYNQLVSLRQELSNFDSTALEQDIKLPKLSEKKLRDKIAALRKIVRLISEKDVLTEKMSQLEVVSDKEITKIKKKIKKAQESIKRCDIIEDLKELRDEIKPRRSQIKTLKRKINNLAKLRQLFVDAEYSSYERVAERLNLYIEDIVSDLFVDPIKIKVSMFKKLKTKDRIKPVVNLSVYHRGYEIDINLMSGGERDRISVAITLAMMKMSKSPMVLMDEVFSSLDAKDHIRAFNVLSKYGRKSKKMFLFIGHNMKSGWYDDILEIST